MSAHEFLVVGAGWSGLACAKALSDAGRTVVVHEKDRLGGRARTVTVGGRPVDVGAAYFTASVPAFVGEVGTWSERELVMPWTDTFHVATPDGVIGTHSGPMRYVARGGLSALAVDFAEGIDVVSDTDVSSVGAAEADGHSYAGVAVTCPSPEALAILDPGLVSLREAATTVFDPCVVAVLEYADRSWLEFDACFVNDSALITFVVDDGRRAGDGHPTLVVYGSPVLSAAHLGDPASVVDVLLPELDTCLGVRVTPRAAEVFPWRHARPRRPRPEPCLVGDQGVGLCGDAWHAPSRLQSAYLSGRALGRALQDIGRH